MNFESCALTYGCTELRRRSSVGVSSVNAIYGCEELEDNPYCKIIIIAN